MRLRGACSVDSILARVFLSAGVVSVGFGFLLHCEGVFCSLWKRRGVILYVARERILRERSGGSETSALFSI